MKFWELTSAFRDYEKQLGVVLNADRWKTPFGEWFGDIDNLVENQLREKLDYELPDELVLEIARAVGSSLNLYLGQGYLRSHRHDTADIELSALQVVQSYGGEALEEALEKSMVEVKT